MHLLLNGYVLSTLIDFEAFMHALWGNLIQTINDYILYTLPNRLWHHRDNRLNSIELYWNIPITSQFWSWPFPWTV